MKKIALLAVVSFFCGCAAVKTPTINSCEIPVLGDGWLLRSCEAIDVRGVCCGWFTPKDNCFSVACCGRDGVWKAMDVKCFKKAPRSSEPEKFDI